MQQKERTYYGDTSTVLYAGDGSSYVPSATPEYVAQYESSTTGNYPYVDSSALRDNNITGGKWTNSQGGWTTYNGQSGRALAISSATPTTTTLTFEYDVASGYKMSAASFSFYQRASSTGYSQYTLSINGTQVGSGNLFVDVISQDNPLQWTGDQTLTTAMNNLTGHVTVVITLSGGTHGAQGTFRMDNFSLNGYTVPTSYSNAAPNLYIHKYNYRYGFNGKENDNEVKGEGDEQDYGMRIYDPRVGRFLSVDPLQKKFAFYSPYQFAGNTPVQATDLDGAEIYHYSMSMDKQGNAVLTPIGTVKYSNHHSWFWGMFEFDTKVDVKRYIVDYDGKKYHIGFPLYGTGLANGWKTEDFENNYIKKQGSAIAFESNYVDDEHSQAASDVSIAVNSQNLAIETAIPMGEHTETPTEATNKQATAANGGSAEAKKTNTGSGKSFENHGSEFLDLDLRMKEQPFSQGPKSFEDLVNNPKAIWGKSAADVQKILGKDWTQEPLNSGVGWKFTSKKDGGFISYTTGNSHHPNSEYYKINSGKSGKMKVVGSGYVPTSNDKSTVIKAQ